MIKKRSINILGHKTSISLEQEFWDTLKYEAEQEGLSLNALIAQIDAQQAAKKESYNLSSTLRIYVLQKLQKRLNAH